MVKLRFLVCLVIVGLSSILTEAQQTSIYGNIGDGKFRNPVIPSDYSDPDIIRVGEDYYGIASTFCFSPGMIVIHSRDLVNWEIINHVVDDISFLNPDLDGNSMNGYYNGIWAGSLREHAGRYYCHFTTPKGGWFVAVTDDIYGKWTVDVMKDSEGDELRGAGWDDVCPLWDDDGQAYIIASNFGRHWFPHIFKMSDDGTQLLDAVIDKNCDRSKNIELIGGYVVKPYRTAEAGKLYKFNGKYYIYFSEVRKIHGKRVRVPMMRRADSMYGPYEEHILLHSHGKDIDKEPNQGAIVDTPDGGKWCFVTHHGTGDFDGRVLSVLPVHWRDGWPEIGVDTDGDGVGEMVWEVERPIISEGSERMQTSDSFDGYTLGHQWEFNHQPIDSMWTLIERPGYLRMYAFPQLDKANFFKTRNVLSQRYIRWGTGVAETCIELAGVRIGQEAGVAVFNGGRDYAYLSIKKDTDCYTVMYSVSLSGSESESKDIMTIPLGLSRFWIKCVMDFDGKSQLLWSSDGETYNPVDTTFQLKWGSYRGARIGLFTFNNTDNGGYADFDYFRYERVSE